MSQILTPEVCDRLRLTKEVALELFAADSDNTDPYAAAWQAFDRAEVFVLEYDRRYRAQEDAAEFANTTPCPESITALKAAVMRLTTENADLRARHDRDQREITSLRRLWDARESRGFKGRVGRGGL